MVSMNLQQVYKVLLRSPSVMVWFAMSRNEITQTFFLNLKSVWDRVTKGCFVPMGFQGFETILEDMKIEQDGAPSHCAVVASQNLKRMLPNFWVGRAGKFIWPPRSPYLTACDKNFWEYLKDLAFREIPTSKDELYTKVR